MTSVKFKKIAIQGWRQFESVEIDLHDRLTIITGANGAGKSSLLRIFSKHFGFDKPFLSVPVLVDGKFEYKIGLFTGLFKAIGSWFSRAKQGPEVGKLQYTDGAEASLVVNDQGGVQYHLEILGQAHVDGVHIDSHQAVTTYRTVESIPANLITAEIAYQQYHSEIHQRYQGGYGGYSPLYRMKESILAMAAFGESHRRSAGNAELRSALDGFVTVLRKVLPPSLGFMDLAIRSPEIVLQTRSGEFLLDAASGGVSTIIDMAWRLHMYSIGKDSFVVTIDEPENHLHPSMQRSLMRRLMDAFPSAQFIVATHSPFIVSSVKDSSVYVLRYRSSDERESSGFVPETTQNRIVSLKLDTVEKSSSANEILREVLGVESTVPEWVAEDIDKIVATFGGQTLTKDSLHLLRNELEHLGYQDQYPSAIAKLMDMHGQAH